MYCADMFLIYVSNINTYHLTITIFGQFFLDMETTNKIEILMSKPDQYDGLVTPQTP